jgi:hypothetical protein
MQPAGETLRACPEQWQPAGQVADQFRFAHTLRAENERIPALRVQLSKLGGFLSPTDKRKREAHFLAALNIAPP